MSAPLPSIESLVVGSLPAGDRELLRCGAVLRYITRPLAQVVTDSAPAAQRLVDHPVVRSGAQGRADELWTIAQPLRKALLAGWPAADEIRARVAADTSAGLEGRYARLATGATRAAALADLADEVVLALREVDVPRAHDLLRLLDEWPVTDAAEARALRDRLTPRLRRHSRAARDREATATYFERGFEQPVWEMLLSDDDRWMLQLHGPGGRGKTMFVKNLLGRRCPERDIPVARIDFDHVTQLGIATTEPWRLLLSIAAQLDPQLPGAPFDYMLSTYATLQSVTQPEALPRVPPVSAVTAGTRSDELAVRAAAELPEKFRTHLARAVGDGPVVIALDTVENVLHADGAELAPVLAMFGEVFHGTGDPDDARVPGLRLVVSGRFDIAGVRPTGPEAGADRAPGVRERWVGPADQVTRDCLSGTEVQLGREITTLEMPGFTPDEARRFLTDRCGLLDLAIVEAIVGRTHDNPMKLALLAEYVTDHPDVTAETISSFERIDLFYLVDRVVDRIADGPVQWLLRWGALLPVLSREAAEQVVWPALRDFAGTGGGYDDTDTDGLPAPAADVSRWPVPEPDQIRAPGSFDRAWAALLDYTAHASWAYRVEELPDAVSFHPEVREPLRRLLRQGGHPAYDDIHRRSFAYWSGVLGSAQRTTRIAALRAMLFHAYQPWDGAEHDGDRLFRELLGRSADDRGARGALAREVLELSNPDDDSGGPSAEARSRAHLEVAETVIDEAVQRGAPVAEAALSYHVSGIGPDVRFSELRRVRFLRAVLAESAGDTRKGWALVGSALDDPAPGAPDLWPGLALMAGWAGDRTPPPTGLQAAARLLREVDGTRWTEPAARALTRGLLAAERWIDAADAAGRTGSAELRAAAATALGDAATVLRDRINPGIWRARARLLRYEPSQALRELDAAASSARAPTALLVRGQAFAQLGRREEALAAFSQAASGPDTAVSVEAGLEIARLGGPDLARAHLRRLRGFDDPVVVLRAALLDIRLQRSASLLADAEAEGLLVEPETLPASVRVELAVTRLAVDGVAGDNLDRLADALLRVQGAGPRLLALGGLVDVPTPEPGDSGPVQRLLLGLVDISDIVPPVVLLLARAELSRVLGEGSSALPALYALDDPDRAIARAVGGLHERVFASERSLLVLESERSYRPVPSISDGGERAGVELRLNTDPYDGGIRITRPGTGPATTVPAGVLAEGASALARRPESLLDELGRALVPDGSGPAGGRPLDLYLGDADAARWPWEVASIPGPDVLLRRHNPAPPVGADIPGPVPAVAARILYDRPGREYLADLIVSAYGPGTTVHSGTFSGPPRSRSGSDRLDGGILHIVADPVDRNRLPALLVTGGELLTPESLALTLSGRPRLVILDVVLAESDHDAADQLTTANAFGWHLVRGAPDVDVLCGMFSAGDREDAFRGLVTHLHRGSTLAELARDLQRARPRMPGGQPRWRDAVTLSTDRPDRRYRLS